MKIPNPKISVLLPVFNSEMYIKDAISCILSQTYGNFELIILNDGSTDNTEKIILKFNDNRIKYFKSENQGIVYQLNKGIHLAKGPYIARMDGDDISHRERFAKQLKYLENNVNIDAIGTAYFRIDPNGHKIGKKNVPIVPKECEFVAQINSPILHPTLMIKSDVIKNLGGYNEKYNLIEDYDLFIRMIDNGYQLANIGEPLYYYRINNKNLNLAKEKYQRKSIYIYGNRYLNKKILKSKSVKLFLQKAILEYYLGKISTSRKYFLKVLLKKPSKFFLIIRYLPILILGDHTTRYLRERGILFKFSYFLNNYFQIDLNKLFR